MAEAPRYRQLPAYIDTGAKRDVWQYIVDEVTGTGEDWAYFRVKTLPEMIQDKCGREYHQGTISRALKALSGEDYIEYRPGTRGQVSMARPVLAQPALDTAFENDEPDPRAEGGGA